MEKKQFKAESKRLLDLMINSIYTNKEIFLRELISNSSDAIDKLHYRSLTDSKIEVKQSDLAINIEIDKDNRNLIIKDNGCGMTENMVWEINNGIFGNAENKNHIGMENAITRIQMYYGEKAKVNIESELDKGTKVEVWIPLS